MIDVLDYANAPEIAEAVVADLIRRGHTVSALRRDLIGDAALDA